MSIILAKMVQQSADARIYGVDLSPVPPIYEQPKTVQFIEANITDLPGVDPRFEFGTFDFITNRMVVLGISDRPAYVRTCFSLLKSGGRIELQDIALRWFDINGADISQNWKWIHVLRKASAKIGINTLGPEILRQLMLEAGFLDVEESVFIWPSCDEPWEKHPDSDKIGRYDVRTLRLVRGKLACRMAQKAGLEPQMDLEGLEDIQQLEESCFKDMTGLPKGSHAKFYVVCGRKP